MISTARDGAERRGLYASRSITIPRAVQTKNIPFLHNASFSTAYQEKLHYPKKMDYFMKEYDNRIEKVRSFRSLIDCRGTQYIHTAVDEIINMR